MSIKSAMKVTVMPAGHGDCILVQCDDFNIMVDSGPYRKCIHERVHSGLVTALEGQPIHLAIITHNDDDHIGGLVRTLCDATLSVNALLFNSPQLIRKYIDHCSGEEVNVSTRQAFKVASKLTPCNKKVLVAGDTRTFFDDRIVLRVLSPLTEDILNYGSHMLAPFEKEELAGARGRDTPVCGTIHELRTMDDDGKAADASQTNALSLAFILTFEERSILFLGDSWPSRVMPSLAKLDHEGAPIQLDLVFVSHHGSKNNNTQELYQHIQTERYVISADGKQNPDVETFGRILRAGVGNIQKFYFSENSQQLKTMFSKSDINVYFPDNGPLTFDL
ncbi:MBL fold hydrolase [Comamonas testosteroni]|uniref:MBL fold hydrolase n=1 Tax=Comamonas testosteroni TaxID=285 RepID=A0A5A7MIH3_COMTE|nr:MULTISPECIES: hypothetical protein [Comamonas]BDR09924.1 MBL fold metallo-hydrolase [Comamonas thiooxydans]GEQ76691.1 MBL fold hydrolase [Comamonas testosteroni]